MIFSLCSHTFHHHIVLIGQSPTGLIIYILPHYTNQLTDSVTKACSKQNKKKQKIGQEMAWLSSSSSSTAYCYLKSSSNGISFFVCCVERLESIKEKQLTASNHH